MPRKPIIKRTYDEQQMDEQATSFGKSAARKFSTGRHTASETGASNLAARRHMLDAAMGQSDKKRMKKGIGIR